MTAGCFLPAPSLVENDADDRHCLQACIQMVMKTCANAPVLSFEDINAILRQKKGLYAWNFAILSALGTMGFDVMSVGAFSASRLVAEKESYLLDFFGEKAGRTCIENSDMPVLFEEAEKFLKSPTVQNIERVPTPEDLRTALRDGWYAVPNINARILNGGDGFSGHFVFLYGFDDEAVTFHDPGLPPIAARRVPWGLFIKAWSSPSETSRNVDFFRAAKR